MTSKKVERQVVVSNRHGLHMRPATALINLANRYGSSIEITSQGRTVNGKSIMEILTLAAARGAVLRLSAEGSDAEEAVQAIASLIENRFGEDS